MNKLLTGLLSFSLLSSFVAYSENSCCTNTCDTCNVDCSSCCVGPCDAYPFLQIRSQGRNTARRLVACQDFINRFDEDETYGLFSVAVEYTRTFREERLADFLFGRDLVNCCELYIQGSGITNRHRYAWLADYFGLPTDYDSRVRFSPRIQNAIIDINVFLGLDELKEGLYFRIDAPLVWTKWQLCPCESIRNKGEASFVAGYMADEEVTRNKLPKNFLQAMSGCSTWGDMKTPMQFGRITNCENSHTRVAEIDLALGYNFLLEQDHHLGFFVYAAVPTGNRPDARKLFEPMVGNGKHWELGGGFSGSWIFWTSEVCNDRYFGLWFEVLVTHLFKTCQCRSFDFCCKPNSRYMLLEQMGSNDDTIQGNVSGTNTKAEYQYKKNLIPAINWSTLNVNVRINAQVDFALKLGYTRGNLGFDLGYNLWARTKEKMTLDNCKCQSDKKYAIKGDAFVYGQDEGNNAFGLSATQNPATIYGGKNYPAINGDNPTSNPRIDNPYEARQNGNGLSSITSANPINTSIQPTLVSTSGLNRCQSVASITHKIFGHFSYAWKDRNECDDCIPFIGFGAEGEFSQDRGCCDDRDKKCCSACQNCNCEKISSSCKSKRGGVSQWGVWVKGGVSFD